MKNSNLAFTIHFLPFTLLSPFTFHNEVQGKRIKEKAWKMVNGEWINAALKGVVL